jgi:O-antigen ligase
VRSGGLRATAGACATLTLAAGSLAWAPPALLAGALAGVVATASPAVALALAALAVPFGPLGGLALGGATLTPAPVLLGLAALGRSAVRLARRRPVIPPGRHLAGLMLYLLALALGTLGAPSPTAALFEVARWVALGLAFALAAGLAGRDRAIRFVLAALLVAGTLEAALGIRQALAGSGPEAFRLSGATARAFGDFGQPNPFAGYMNMVWPLAAALLLPLPARPGGGRRVVDWPADGALLVLALLALPLTGWALALSWSRGAWLAAAAGAAAMALGWLVAALRPPVRLGMLILVSGLAVALGGALVVGPGGALPASIASRLGSIGETFAVWDVADAEVDDANFATIERVAHWQAAAAMWAERPWLGQGPGHYELAYGRFRLPRWAEPLGHAHNYYLHSLAETGLVGLSGYLAFIGSLFWVAGRALLAGRTAVEAALGLGLVGVLAALAVHSLTDNLYVHDLPVQLGLLAGLTVAARGRP